METQTLNPPALDRLTTLARVLEAELDHLPAASISTDDQIGMTPTEQADHLHARIAQFWSQASARDISRRELFVTGLELALRDDVSLSIEEGELHADYQRCLPGADEHSRVEFSSLQLQIDDGRWIEIAGAIISTAENGQTLLSLPGQSGEGFTSKQAMTDELTRRINHPVLRLPLLRTLPESTRDAWSGIQAEGDLFLENWTASDWRLTRVKGSAFDYAFDRLLDKQHGDINELFATSVAGTEAFAARLDALMRMPKSWGPDGMIVAIDHRLWLRSERQKWPDWLRMATVQERQHYARALEETGQAISVLTSVMGDAASPEHYARSHLRARIANDLGHDIDPDQLRLSTQRPLPGVAQTYTNSRSLTQLGLIGLHPGDSLAGSSFLTDTQVTLNGRPLTSAHERLTLAYLAKLIDELDLRSAFGQAQRQIYGSETTQRQMREVMHRQLLTHGYAAALQGHLSPDGYALIESLNPATTAPKNHNVTIQRLVLNGRDTLGGVLVLRTLNDAGELDSLMLYAADIPRAQRYQRFTSERQLLNELVSWSRSTQLSEFLVAHVAPTHQAALVTQLQRLAELPAPPENFVSYSTCPDYDAGLRGLVSAHIQMKLAEQRQHTPDWYLNASKEQRQQLVALEDALVAVRSRYEAQPHTHVPDFEAFVHSHASRKINELLGLPDGSVDPDQIIITSPRETLTYTRMLRDGYDDSLSLLTPTADTTASFTGPAGVDLSKLTPSNVARSVHGQWVLDQYVEKIRSQLLDPQSEGYTWRRRQSLLLTQLQMSADALRSLLKGQIDAGQHQWLSRTLEHLHSTDPALRARYPVYPLQLKVDVLAVAVKVETLQGCYLLRPEGPGAASQALLYTPQAPDGYAFRPLESFSNTLLRDGMGDYYLKRGRAGAGRSLAFALADLKKGKGMAPAFADRPLTDLHDVCFNHIIERKIADAQATTTGRADMLARLIWSSVEMVAIVLTLPFPPASFAVGMVMAGVDSYRALAALHERDHEAASLYVLSAWLNTAGSAGDLYSGMKGLGGVLKRVARSDQSVPTSSLPGVKTEGPLTPVIVQDEVFWAAASETRRHVPLCRTRALMPDTLQPTGHFAETDISGVWKALQQDSANPAYVVSISLAEGTPLDAAHAQGVTMLRGKCYIAMHDQIFQVQYDASMRIWQIVDPGNPFAFFGRQPVRRSEQGLWETLEPLKLRGGVLPVYQSLDETAAGPTTAASSLSDYEMPEGLQPYVFGIVSVRQAESYSDSTGHLRFMFDDIFLAGRETYSTLRQNLYRDAAAFFEQPALKTKPALPQLESETSVEAFLKAAFTDANGLVIGEAPTLIASKQLLIDNMPLLAEQKIEVLYLEHLQTDQHVHKLQKYKALGSKTRSGSHQLKHYLDTVNDGALKSRSDKYDYYHVIKAAHRHGIEVKPFSSSVSYDFADNEVSAALGDPLAQHKMSAFFGNKVISDDVQAQPQRRWIALLDHRIANKWQHQPGISELQGVISLRVVEVPQGQAQLIARDTDDALGAAQTRGDFRVEIPCAHATPTAGTSAAAAEPSTALDDALYNLLERRSPLEWGLDPHRKSFVSQRKLAANLYAGEHGFQWHADGYWARAQASQWPKDPALNAIQISLIDDSYQLPAAMRPVFHELAYFRHRGLNPNYFFPETELAEVRKTFFELGASLQKSARELLSAEVPTRVAMPDIKADTPISMFLEELYENTSGVVIGESHAAIASKRLILDNLEYLSKQNVKTLYMEHLLTDLHQADLDLFAETGLMSKTLLHDIKAMDKGFRTDKEGVYTFENLLLQARRHGVEVRAIDCAASYFIRNLPTTSDSTRQQVFSYFASRTIRKHQSVIGAHKWIALVGNSHANTFKNSVPGIAELERAIGVRVMDVAPGKGRGIMLDPGEEVSQGIASGQVFLKNDFRVEIELQPRAQLAIPVGDRLYNPGMFLLEQSDSARPVIIHRSRDRTLKRTPVRLNGEGRFYIERDAWPQVHLKPFDDLASLTDALVQMKLKHVA